jgi:hypothetical protein
MTVMKSIVSGKRLLGLGLIMSLVAIGVWQTTTRTGTAQSVGGFEGAIFTVTPVGTQTFAIPAASGAFSVEGTIECKNERGQSLSTCLHGKFYRTGIKLDSGAAVVQDVYVVQELNGAIMAEGVLNPEIPSGIDGATPPVVNLTAAVGGVGTFRGAIGEMQITTNINGVGTTNPTGTFTARLLEVPRRRGDDNVR